MKLTYRTPPYDDDDGDLENSETESKESRDTDGLNHMKSQWDDECPWAEWYSAEDPVKGIISLSFFLCYGAGNMFALFEIHTFGLLDAIYLRSRLMGSIFSHL